MDRKAFIKTCGMACLSGSLLGLVLESCGTARTITGTISGSDLLVPLSAFEEVKGEQKNYKRYIVVHHETLQYPVCIYRFSESSYSALWMRCTHQGSELQVFGDKLQCPAHGSEFDNKGSVQSGPADIPLRSFPVIIEQQQLKISLNEPEK